MVGKIATPAFGCRPFLRCVMLLAVISEAKLWKLAMRLKRMASH
jgi:hypothetical protein